MNDLTNYFKYLESVKIKKDFNLVREYPRYSETLKRYKEKYKECLSKPVELVNISSRQVYSIPYDLVGGGFFELKISVDKLYNLVNDINNKVISKNSEDYKEEFTLKCAKSNEDIIQMHFNVEILKMIIDERNIDKEYAQGCVNNKKDIICADFSGITAEKIPFVIVDGNHRCYGKIKEGYDHINGVLVSRNVWMNCLLTEVDKIFIKIYHNMNLILTYRAGRIDKKYADSILYNI